MANILIIKFGALGDVVMATSLIKQIQDHHPEDTVHFLTSNQFVSLFENWNDLTVSAFPRRGFISTIKTIRWIRQKNFDRLYDLQSNDRTRLICALSRVKQRVGNHPFFPYNIHPEEKYTGQCHIFDRMLEVINCAGIQSKMAFPTLPASETEKNKISQWLQENSLEPESFVIMHAGSSPEHKNKRWPYYQELATKLKSKGYDTVWIGADADIDLNNSMCKIVGINATNLFNVVELAELGRYAKFAITNDSGPMHILSCSEIPVFAFFGPTYWKRNHAIGQGDNVFAATNGNLDQITVNQVINRLHSDGL